MAMTTPGRYQVSRNGQVIGTFDSNEMIAKVATGQVLPTDYYWTAGMAAWARVSAHEEWMRHVPKAAVRNQVAPPPPTAGSALPPPVNRPVRTYPADMMVCAQCGSTGTESHTKGSFLIEVVLWLFMCVPGLIYSIWRLTTRGQVCRACKSDRLVPANSPTGQNLLSRP
jgi:hypothetical protein